MTLYHFGNCLALVYAPYHMAYKFSGISEYATFSKCVYAGGLYIFTQLCKMLLLATFFPDTEKPGEFNLLMEFLKATVDYADLIGLYFALNSVPGKGHAKIFTAAIGWASADVAVTLCVPLWVGARGSEFSWRYVRAAADSNVALLRVAAAAALVWLAGRTDLPPRAAPLAAALLALHPHVPLVERALAPAALASPASPASSAALLAVRALHAAATALAALAMYASLARPPLA